jgi:DNA invertase Pin-like site-specific DNA recombinase
MKTTDFKTAAAYIRVSTDHQTELSPDSQIKTIRQYAKQHGYLVPNEYIFRDDGISGRHAEKRPQFVRMIAAAKEKPSPFSAILLWKFSRFARNQEESIFYKAQLKRNGVDVISVSEPIMDGPFGSLIERIIEWTDEYYSIRLSGEVKRGMLEKVERGQAVTIPSFGYDIVDKKYVINQDTAPLVRMMYNDYLNGMPMKRIAIKINEMGIKTTRGNVWENRTVEYILRNPVYIGKIRWNPKRRTRRAYDDPDILTVDGEHEPIISEEIFNRVQEKILETKKQYKKYERIIPQEYMLHSLVKCSSCGLSLGKLNKGKYLQCTGYSHGKCNVSHHVSLEKMNKLVIDTIELAFKTECFQLIEKGTAAPDYKINIESLIEKQKAKLSRIREAYEDGVYTLDEFKESKNDIEKHISRLREQVPKKKESNAELKRKLIIEKAELIPCLRNLDTTEEEKNEILKSFVDKIVYDKASESIDIFFYV